MPALRLQRRPQSFCRAVLVDGGLPFTLPFAPCGRAIAGARLKGMAIALEFDSEQEASRIVERAVKAGLLLTTEGNVVLVLPPLTVTKALRKKAYPFFVPARRRAAGGFG